MHFLYVFGMFVSALLLEVVQSFKEHCHNGSKIKVHPRLADTRFDSMLQNSSE